MKSIIKTLGSIVALAALSGSLLHGSVVVYSGAWSLDVAPYNTSTFVGPGAVGVAGPLDNTNVITPAIPKFDPNIGTLTGVRIRYHGIEVDVSYSLTNSTGEDINLLGNVNGGFAVSFTLQDPVFAGPPSPNYNNTGGWFVGGGSLDAGEVFFNDSTGSIPGAHRPTSTTFYTTGIGGFVAAAPGDELDFFIQAGLIGNLVYEYVQAVGSDQLDHALDGSVEGLITVTYEFTPIPEPGTVIAGVLFAGLIGFVGYRRFRAKKAAASDS